MDLRTFFSSLGIGDSSGRECQSKALYTGDRCRLGTDGEYSLMWSDHCTQIMFHVAVMMPNEESGSGGAEASATAEPSPQFNKKRHLGNDFVQIIYYHQHSIPSTNWRDGAGDIISGQFNFVHIFVHELDEYYRVELSEADIAYGVQPSRPSCTERAIERCAQHGAGC